MQLNVWTQLNQDRSDRLIVLCDQFRNMSDNGEEEPAEEAEPIIKLTEEFVKEGISQLSKTEDGLSYAFTKLSLPVRQEITAALDISEMVILFAGKRDWRHWASRKLSEASVCKSEQESGTRFILILNPAWRSRI